MPKDERGMIQLMILILQFQAMPVAITALSHSYVTLKFIIHLPFFRWRFNVFLSFTLINYSVFRIVILTPDF